MIREKYPQDSYTEQVQVLSQANLNGFGRLFGGKLMEWIDVVAVVVGRRHSECNVTTAVVDSLEFRAPAHANDTVLLCGRLTWVGKTSMEVRVRSYVEELDGSRRLINTAYLVLVALDEQERPTEVPRLILESDEDERLWQDGQKRSELRRQRRAEKF